MEYKGTVYAKIAGKYIPCTDSFEMVDLKASTLDKLITKLSHRRIDIEKNLKDTRDERLSEIGWIEHFIYCKLNDITDDI
jgi:hypothetical protein